MPKFLISILARFWYSFQHFKYSMFVSLDFQLAKFEFDIKRRLPYGLLSFLYSLLISQVNIKSWWEYLLYFKILLKKYIHASILSIPVPANLSEVLVKLLRKVKKTVKQDKWEKSLVAVAHTFSSIDAWEIERFGYKKAKLTSKVRVLKVRVAIILHKQYYYC